MQAFLSTIGPLVNNNFEFESIKAQVLSYIKSEKTSYILYEEGLEHEDVDFKKFLDSIEHKSFNIESGREIGEEYEPKRVAIGLQL